MKTKRIFILGVIFLIMATCLSTNQTSAKANQNYYARVESATGENGVSFYRTIDSESLFSIPNNYFVIVSDIKQDYYVVTYKDLQGYVKRNDASLVEGTPQIKFPSATITVFDTQNMYSSATNKSTPITITNDVVMTYYGEKEGAGLQKVDQKLVTTWYFVSAYVDGQRQEGYIYTNYVSEKPFVVRDLSDPDLTLPTISDDVLIPPQPQNFSKLSTGTQVMLIVAISVPSLLILYFLIKPTKLMQTNKSKKNAKKGKRRISHGDYFEFDESEL